MGSNTIIAMQTRRIVTKDRRDMCSHRSMDMTVIVRTEESALLSAFCFNCINFSLGVYGLRIQGVFNYSYFPWFLIVIITIINSKQQFFFFH